MNLSLSPAEQAFRDELRAFFAEAVTDELRARVRTGLRLEPAEYTAWQRTLHARGWGAPTWPAEHGGTGWTPVQQYLFEAESARAGAPQQFHQGLELIGPVIFTFGTAEQKRRYLPAILSGDDWWCQGYSEPGAGSDLAALSTRAELDGDHYVVTGQKIWTSYAHVANRMFCLVRTGEKAGEAEAGEGRAGGGTRKQDGISLLLVDLPSPGLRIRPILTLDERHHVNEVFLDAVRVPAANLVGEPGRGWSYGKVLLDRERMVAAAAAIRLGQVVALVRDCAARQADRGRRVIDGAGFRLRLAQAEVEAIALEWMALRSVMDAQAGAGAGVRASMIKLRWSEILQRLTELWVEAQGYGAAAFAPVGGANAALPGAMPFPVLSYLHSRVTTIYGGSSEVQRNIIARRGLGL